MSSHKKLLSKILDGASDAGISFSKLCQLLKKIGFNERIKGGHYIFTRMNVAEIINLQPKSSKAKPYQVKQVRQLILKYHLHLQLIEGGQNEKSIPL